MELFIYFEFVDVLEVIVFELAPLCLATKVPRQREIVALPSFLPSSALSASIMLAILIYPMFKSPKSNKI